MNDVDEETAAAIGCDPDSGAIDDEERAAIEELNLVIERSGEVTEESDERAVAPVSVGTDAGPTEEEVAGSIILGKDGRDWCVDDFEVDGASMNAPGPGPGPGGPVEEPDDQGLPEEPPGGDVAEGGDSADGIAVIEELVEEINNGNQDDAEALVCSEAADLTYEDIGTAIDDGADISDVEVSSEFDFTVIADIEGTVDGNSVTGSVFSEPGDGDWCVGSFYLF